MEVARVSVRIGTNADIPYVLDLGKRCVMASVSGFRTPIRAMVDVSFERLVAYVSEQSHVILIAESADAPAGFLLLLDTMPDEVTLLPQAFVAYMAVEPDMRRRGAAKAMLAEAESYARRNHLPTLSMMVTEENTPATSLYAQAGFFTERRMLTKVLT